MTLDELAEDEDEGESDSIGTLLQLFDDDDLSVNCHWTESEH